MRRINIICDAEPEVTHLWNAWEIRRARIEKKRLIVELSYGTLTITSADPQFVADIFFSHDPKSDIVTGKLGIEKVEFAEKKPKGDTESRLIETLKELMQQL